MKKVVFWDCGIYHLLHCKKIPPFNGNFYGKIYSKNFEKKNNLKQLSKSPLLSREKFHQLTYIFIANYTMFMA
jgi:hypothetical protein